MEENISIPKKPVIQKEYKELVYWWYACPNCLNHLKLYQNECDKCNQLLDWSDEDPGVTDF